MEKKPQAGEDKRKKRAAIEQKEQSAQFVAAARKFGVDESGKDFELAIIKIVRPQKP